MSKSIFWGKCNYLEILIYIAQRTKYNTEKVNKIRFLKNIWHIWPEICISVMQFAIEYCPFEGFDFCHILLTSNGYFSETIKDIHLIFCMVFLWYMKAKTVLQISYFPSVTWDMDILGLVNNFGRKKWKL